MKWCIYALVAIIPVAAQQTIQTNTYDGFGNTMPSAGSSFTSRAGNTSTLTRQVPSINGGTIPAEKIEETVLLNDGTNRTVERTIRRYDQNGQPLPPEKIRIEEHKAADGSTSVQTSKFLADMNGRMALTERSLAETRKSGSSEVTNETVERPTIDGRVEVSERRATTVNTTASASVKNTTIYKRDANGRFFEALKQTAEARSTPSGSEENMVTYEATPVDGFRLRDQIVTRTMKAADGNPQVVMDVYTANNPGIVGASSDSKPVLREQRVISRQATQGKVTETVDVRRASISDPNRLGAPIRESETVCTGVCK